LVQGQTLRFDATVPQIYSVYNANQQFFGLAEFVPGKGLIAKRLCVLDV